MEGRRVMFTMKGFWVRRRVSRMAPRNSSSVVQLPAVRFPIPPALETAAHRGGLHSHIMAPQIIGYLRPNSSVMAVLNMGSSWKRGGIVRVQGNDIRNDEEKSTGNHLLPTFNFRPAGVKPIEFQALPGPEARALRAKTMR